MSFQQFLQTRRDELITLCSAEPAQGRLDGLARDIMQCFADIAEWEPSDEAAAASATGPALAPNADAVMGSGSAMTQLRIQLEQLSHRSRAPVLLVGEAGAGRRHLGRALADNNQTRAASLLGLTRDQIRYRMSKFEILAPARGG